MINNIIQNRLAQLRDKMKHEKIDYFFIPTADYHNSEYVSDFFKVREYFCGFTGSNGNLLVWQDGAGLWTDGRYFIQAEMELSGTGVTLFRMAEEGVPTIYEFLTKNMKKDQCLGFDGRVVTAQEGLKLESDLSKLGVSFQYEIDPADGIWSDRTKLPISDVYSLPLSISGLSVSEKCDKVMKKVEEAGAEALLLTKLDDLMWLFNIRGGDVECNPVALSYGMISREKRLLFIRENTLSDKMKQYFKENDIEILPYEKVTEYISSNLLSTQRIITDRRHTSYCLYKKVKKSATLIEGKNPTELLKAVKNPVEQKNMEAVYLKDNVALTKFIYWLKQSIGKMELTEISVADKLEEFRREIPEFVDLSFPTISAYNENAAMMHYEATKDHYSILKKEGMLLVDSGAQYMGGTTDVTRTIVLGTVSDEVRKHYTLVLSGMLQLSRAKWLYGCTGRNLDILARQPLWNIGIDYKCGTGHGVGYILNVHEGPQNIRWRFIDGMTEAVIEDGMDVTNEPGVYIEGSHGIRIENVMLAHNDVKNTDGQFMHFDTLTYVPIDREAVDTAYLTDENRKSLNDYQALVYEKLSPYLTEDERTWLYQETQAF